MILQFGLPQASELTDSLRNGVVFAKLAKFFDMSNSTQQARIYDENEEIYKVGRKGSIVADCKVCGKLFEVNGLYMHIFMTDQRAQLSTH